MLPGGISYTELLVILAIVVLLFGASRIPEVGKALGSGIRNFKKALSGEIDVEEETKVKEVKAKELDEAKKEEKEKEEAKS